ncbi:MAG: alpha/beta hydrolase [Verrucomicrobiae bacterium]|nr:alpha/beta hydrolase [Verrucomicrobiae bacterium]
METDPERTSPGFLARLAAGFRRLMVSLISIYVMLGLALWWIGDRLAHHPPRGGAKPLPGEITLVASDGVPLSAVWLPRPDARVALLLSHGNAEDLDHLFPFLRELQEAGFAVFAYDYRGYGRSKGRPTEKGVERDLEAAWRHLTGPLGIPPSRVMLLGRSLGSGPTCWLAAREKPGGVILESAFTSGQRVLFPFPLFPFDQFPNLRRIPEFSCPVLLVHGVADTIIPIHHGRALFAAAREPKFRLWIEGAGHNDLFGVAPELYLKTLQDFATRVAAAPDRPSP